MFQPLNGKFHDLKMDYNDLSMTTQGEIEHLKSINHSLEEDFKKLEQELSFKSAECEILLTRSASEHSHAANRSSDVFRSSQDGSLAHRRSQLLDDVVDELKEMKLSRDKLSKELHSREGEVSRLRSELETQRIKARQVVAQVEGVIREEEQQSAEVVRALNAKLGSVREQLMVEVNKQRRLVQTRDKELELERDLKLELARELKALQASYSVEQETFSKESRRFEGQRTKITELQRALAARDRDLFEKDGRITKLEMEVQQLREQYEVFKRSVTEERQLLKRMRDNETTRAAFDNRLHYQNSLRHSYTFGDTSLEDVVLALRNRSERGDRGGRSRSQSPAGRGRGPSYKIIDDELRNVRTELSETKAQALREQQESLAALSSMRDKFDQLLRSHEEGVMALRTSSQRLNDGENKYRKYEVVLLGVLKSLVTLGLAPDTLARELVEMAMQAREGLDVDLVFRKSGDVLNKFVMDLNAAQSEVERLRVDNTRIANLENEVRQAHQDNQVMKELTKLESTSQIQLVNDKLREAKSNYNLAIQKVEAEASRKQEDLRKTFEEEFKMLRKGFEAKVATLTGNLKTEHRRRKETQHMLAAKEDTMQRLFSEHDYKINKLDNTSLSALD
jgi:hypothetical protein